MAVLDRTTRRLIEGLKARVKFLTVLVIILSLALTTMTILYIRKDTEAPPKDTSSNLSSTKEISSSNVLQSSSLVNEQSSDISSEDESYSSSTSSETSSDSVTANAILGDSTSSWNLKLVNGKNSLPKGYSVKTTTIKSAYNAYGYITYDSRAISYLHAMCAAAEKDGIHLSVISGFRTNEKQQSLFNNQVAKQRINNPGLSEEELIKKASTVSAYPGTSEHELGLAVDFNSVEETFENTSQFQWLQAHAEEYGFIMRYAREKQSITGVIYEPWHYRFVGEEHAKRINDLGYCLEEYIDYLKKSGK